MQEMLITIGGGGGGSVGRGLPPITRHTSHMEGMPNRHLVIKLYVALIFVLGLAPI